MTIDPKLMKAILAMDSYNRGYNEGIKNITGNIGNYSVLRQSDTAENSDGVNAGFYAIAYQNTDSTSADYGHVTISYRGTDQLPNSLNPLNWTPEQLVDISQGWIVGGGATATTALQAELAIKFYQAVAGDGNWQTADVTTAGHSLGGGLSGLVAGLYGKNAVNFDSMPFTKSLENTYKDAAEYNVTWVGILSGDTHNERVTYETLVQYQNDAAKSLASATVVDSALRTLVYGADAPWQTATSKIAGAYAANEALQAARAATGEPTYYTPVYPSGNENSNGGLTPVQLHSMSTFIIAEYGLLEVTDARWKKAAQYFLPVMHDDVFADLIDMDKIAGGLSEKGSYSDILRTMIAYSAIDEGVTVFGDTGIRALYNDANELGTALQETYMSQSITNHADDISKVFVQYAAELAADKVLKSEHDNVLNGVLDYNADVHTLTVDFSDALWDLGANGVPMMMGRNALFQALLDDTGMADSIRDDMEALWGDRTEKVIEKITFVTWRVGTTVTPDAPSSDKATMLVGGANNDVIKAGTGNYILLGGGDNDTVDYSSLTHSVVIEDGKSVNKGALGKDILASIESYRGSRLNDTISGSDGDNIIYGGAGSDTLYVGRGWDAYYGEGTPGGYTQLKSNEGNDVLDFSRLAGGVTLYTSGGYETADNATYGNFRSIEKVIMGDGDDTVSTFNQTSGGREYTLYDMGGGNNSLLSGSDAVLTGGRVYAEISGGGQAEITGFNGLITLTALQKSQFYTQELGHIYQATGWEQWINYNGYDKALTFTQTAPGNVLHLTVSDGVATDVLDGQARIVGSNLGDTFNGAGGADIVWLGLGDDTINFTGPIVYPTISFHYSGGNDVYNGLTSYKEHFVLDPKIKPEDISVIDTNIRNLSGGGSIVSYTCDTVVVVQNIGSLTFTNVSKRSNRGIDGIVATADDDLISTTFQAIVMLADQRQVYMSQLGQARIVGNAVQYFDPQTPFDDVIYGAIGRNIYGGTGNDTFIGGADFINGFYGGIGNDTITGGNIRDSLSGELGDDTISGGGGDDFLYGGFGKDIIYGGDDHDTIYGNAGNDIISGNAGDDKLLGGHGDDTYIFNKGDGEDTIIGGLGSDKLVLGADILPEDLLFTQVGDDLHIQIGSGVLIKDWFLSPDNQIETIQFADGTVVTSDQVDGILANGGKILSDLPPTLDPAQALVFAPLEQYTTPHEYAAGTPEFPVLHRWTRSPNGVDRDNLTLEQDHTVSVSFVSDGGAFRDTLGYYTIGADGVISNVHLLAEDLTGASRRYGRGPFHAGDMIADLGTLPAGTEIGFFMIANGYNINRSLFNKYDMEQGTLSFVTEQGRHAPDAVTTLADAGRNVELVFTDASGRTHDLNGFVYHTASQTLNADGRIHTVSGLNAAGNLQIGFEDLYHGGDRDYNDVVIEVKISPDLHTTFPTVNVAQDFTVTDPDDSLIAGATVALHAQAGDVISFNNSLLTGTNITATQNPDGGFTFTGEDTPGHYQALLQSLTLSSTGTEAGMRQLDITITDHDGLTDSSTINVAIGNPGDTDAFAFLSDDLVFTDGAVSALADALTSGYTMEDGQGNDSLTLDISAILDHGDDVLAVLGDAEDQLHVTGGTLTHQSDTTVNGQAYALYGAASGLSVIVDTDVIVSQAA